MLQVSTEMSGGLSVKDILDKLHLEALNASRTIDRAGHEGEHLL